MRISEHNALIEEQVPEQVQVSTDTPVKAGTDTACQSCGKAGKMMIENLITEYAICFDCWIKVLEKGKEYYYDTELAKNES